MKKLEKKIDEILDSLKDDQSLFAMCSNEEGGFFYSYNSRSDEIGAGVATILDDCTTTESKSQDVRRRVSFSA